MTRKSSSSDASQGSATATQGDVAYAVGYGRPPQHSRFKPGQSGNPKGRAKQSRNLRNIVRQVLDESMQIREAGRLRRMSKFEALVRTTLSRAFKDPKALQALLIIVKQSGYGSDQDDAATGLLEGPAFTEIINDYLARNALDPVQPMAGDDPEADLSGATASSRPKAGAP